MEVPDTIRDAELEHDGDHRLCGRQATKELKPRDIPTILWAWVVSFALLAMAPWIEAGAVTAELLYTHEASPTASLRRRRLSACVGRAEEGEVVDVLKGLISNPVCQRGQRPLLAQPPFR